MRSRAVGSDAEAGGWLAWIIGIPVAAFVLFVLLLLLILVLCAAFLIVAVIVGSVL